MVDNAQEQDKLGDEGMGEGQGEVTVSRCHLCRGLKELRSAASQVSGEVPQAEGIACAKA